MRALGFNRGIGLVVAATLSAAPAMAMTDSFWGIQFEELEYRFALDDTSDVIAAEVDAFYGTDELKARYTNKIEYETQENFLETFENQFLGQFPVSDFFDAKAGIRIDLPDGPNRYYGVLGIQGLAPQWFEVDLDLFVSTEGDVSIRLDSEYELLITNRLILTPALEFDLPFTSDEAIGVGKWGPKLEIGLRLSYDLIDRSLAPYVGVYYQGVFGNSADLAREEGEETSEVYFVVGMRLSF